MKPVFKCDYCSRMDTEQKIKEHEPNCIGNYDRKSCYTCVNSDVKIKNGEFVYECEVGKQVPTGKIFEFCDSYVRKEKSVNKYGNLFDGWLGL